MLLIFFMVTTVMREFDGLKVLLPEAREIEKLESKRNTTYIWASKDGLINIDDRIIQGQALRTILYKKVSSNPKLTISLKSSLSSHPHCGFHCLVINNICPICTGYLFNMRV